MIHSLLFQCCNSNCDYHCLSFFRFQEAKKKLDQAKPEQKRDLALGAVAARDAVGKAKQALSRAQLKAVNLAIARALQESAAQTQAQQAAKQIASSNQQLSKVFNDVQKLQKQRDRVLSPGTKERLANQIKSQKFVFDTVESVAIKAKAALAAAQAQIAAQAEARARAQREAQAEAEAEALRKKAVAAVQAKKLDAAEEAAWKLAQAVKQHAQEAARRAQEAIRQVQEAASRAAQQAARVKADAERHVAEAAKRAAEEAQRAAKAKSDALAQVL